MFASLLDQLAVTDTVVLTPHQRLANSLRDQFDQRQRQNGKSCWPALPVFTFHQWLAQCWQRLLQAGEAPAQLLLMPWQVQQSWEEIIKKHSGTELLQAQACAALALQAWGLAQEWQIDLNDTSFRQQQDTWRWQQWATQFVHQCSEQRWLDEASMANQMLSLFKEKSSRIDCLLLPKQLLFLGFVVLTPQQQQFIQLLRTAGIACRHEQLTLPSAQCYRLAAADTETELHTMAHWVKQSPGITGCIVPQLSTLRDQITRVFEQYAIDGTAPLAKPVAAYPFIHHALIALRLLTSEIALTDLSLLLRSPFLHGAFAESSARALLDQHFRKVLPAVIKTARLPHYLRDQHACPLLKQAIKTLALATERQSTTQWAQSFQQWLSNLGWPGERALNSEEYQLLLYWQTLLEKFARLMLMEQAINIEQALNKLWQLAQGTLFQLQTSNESRVYLLEPHEATGLVFDQLWVMGLHDGAWPATAQANPFLPLQLQKRLALPHASAEQEWQYSQRLTQLFSQAASQVIFSYPLWEGDQPLRPSTLIQSFPEMNIKLSPQITCAESLVNQTTLELITDDQGPALNIENLRRAGSEIFKEQARCPFRAFTRLRLGATSLETPGIGLNARLKGNLIHALLEKLWQTIGSYTQLCAYSENDLAQLIKATVDQTLAQYTFFIEEGFLALEHIRLAKLAHRWLALEKQRQPFTVLATEEKIKTLFGILPLNLRIDRIDQLADGSYFIIDYKTSQCSVQDWLGERPAEPQLPLYCVISTLQVRGIAFAQIRAYEMKFKGYSVNPNAGDGIEYRQDFADLKQSWEAELTRLAHNYLHGDAGANPKHGIQTCRNCDLQMCCRWKAV